MLPKLKTFIEEYLLVTRYDSYSNCGRKDGWQYFHLYNQRHVGLKLGPPFLIKVNEETLEISQDFTREEWFWTIEEECRINKD